jgi:glyoxylase-like metal-dependent hydrolase (beta-lactamase superfamily II)
MQQDGLPENLLKVRNAAVCFYVLRDGEELYLIDSGFIGGVSALEKALIMRGWNDLPIRGVILTHGHLDHIFNVSKIVKRDGAWIAAPRLDASYYNGRPKHQGVSRVTGWLEGLGKSIFSYQSFTPDRYLDDGDFLDVWHGLRTIHLPGHTLGHCGFLCEKLGILFSADLFASWEKFTHWPPAIFNQDATAIRRSAERVMKLNIKGLLPNHCDDAEPAEHLERLRRIIRQASKTR